MLRIYIYTISLSQVFTPVLHLVYNVKCSLPDLFINIIDPLNPLLERFVKISQLLTSESSTTMIEYDDPFMVWLGYFERKELYIIYIYMYCLLYRFL